MLTLTELYNGAGATLHETMRYTSCVEDSSSHAFRSSSLPSTQLRRLAQAAAGAAAAAGPSLPCLNGRDWRGHQGIRRLNCPLSRLRPRAPRARLHVRATPERTLPGAGPGGGTDCGADLLAPHRRPRGPPMSCALSCSAGVSGSNPISPLLPHPHALQHLLLEGPANSGGREGHAGRGMMGLLHL